MTMQNNLDANRLKELETLLARETETYVLVAGSMRRKKELLVAGHYHDLPKLDQELAMLGQKSAYLEARRLALMESMGHTDTTLKQFIGHLDPCQAKPFMDARQKLLRVVNEVRDLNRNNRKLLNLSIQWVQDTVEVIAQAVSPETASYDAKGKRSANPDKSGLPVQSTVIRDA